MSGLVARWPLIRKRALPGIIPSDNPSKIWYLHQARLFDRLTDPQLKIIAKRSEMRKYARGEVILGSAPTPDAIYFVKTGRVKVSALSADGKEQILALLEPGDLFGALAPDQSTELKQAEAFDRSVVCHLPRDLFEDVLRQAPEVAVQVVRILARQLETASARSATWPSATFPAGSRPCCFASRKSTASGANAGPGSRSTSPTRIWPA